MSEPYRPSNGFEGAMFEEQWCCQCERDREYQDSGGERGEGCDILARALAFNIGDAQYPTEWIEIESVGPDGLPINCGECTAFLPRRDPDRPQPSIAIRDDRTKDLFA